LPTSLLGQLPVPAPAAFEGIVTYHRSPDVNYGSGRGRNLRVLSARWVIEGYVLGFDELPRKIDETTAAGGVQLLLQGGLIGLLIGVSFRAIWALSVVRPCAVAARVIPSVAARNCRSRACCGGCRRGLDIGGGGADSRRPASPGCCTATARRPPTNGSTSCGMRTERIEDHGDDDLRDGRDGGGAARTPAQLRAFQDETGGFTAFIT
jgi:hypothetical protein